MQYMDIVIYKSDPNDSYRNSTICIAFNMKDTVISAEEIY